MKVCTKCGETKPLEKFHIDKIKKDGRACRCRDCFKVLPEDRKKYKNPSRPKQCQHCFICFMFKPGGGNRDGGKYCSRQCYVLSLIKPNNPSSKHKYPQSKVSFRECNWCGKLFTNKGNKINATVMCSEVCRDEYKKSSVMNKYYSNHKDILKACRDKYKPKLKPEMEQICKVCGGVFLARVKKSYCSDECSRTLRKNRKERKKARLLGVFYEPVNPIKVFIRDGWRCQLCGKKLNPKHRGSVSDYAPELDHIIPWAKSGEHSYKNTQCACRRCNGLKGSKERGQLRLF